MYGRRVRWDRWALTLLMALGLWLLYTRARGPMVTILTPRPRSLPLEQYVAGVVAAEMPASFPMAALKAQAVAARTYVLYEHSSIRSGTMAQVYWGKATLRQRWGADYAWAMGRVMAAVNATSGEILTYHGQPILAAYSAAAGPVSESSAQAFGSVRPYLPSHPDPYDAESPLFTWVRHLSSTTLSARLGGLPAATTADTAGHVVVVRLRTGRQLRGTTVMARLELPSSDFTFRHHGTSWIVRGYGAGHGVGLDQWGAATMARQGFSAPAILAFYYPGARLRHD